MSQIIQASTQVGVIIGLRPHAGGNPWLDVSTPSANIQVNVMIVLSKDKLQDFRLGDACN